MSENLLFYLGIEFKNLREEKTDLSQVDFAKLLNISRSLVCKVEAGERKYNKELLQDIFVKLSLSDYDRLKFCLLSGFSFKLNNTDADCSNIIKLTIELKDKGLINFAKLLIKEALLVLEESIDFYVLLSTINLLEKNYHESELNIKKALELYNSSAKGISTELEIYHNFGNVFFNESYDYELKRVELIGKLVKEGLFNQDIFLNKDYIDLSSKINKLYNKAEKSFLLAYKISPNDIRITIQMSRLYFNIASLEPKNKMAVDRASKFLSKSLAFENINSEDRLELTVLLSIIMAFNDNYELGIIIINNILLFSPDNYLAYFAKSIIYSYKGKDNLELLNKANYNLKKALSLYDGLKLQALGELSFENIKRNDLTRKEFEEMVF
ncbi:MAG: helix-turn-helix domain-containing protein [Candidatus Sericytochromatia bacterium]|nr:helix-turn-helix domain-containing protein [Candidatus Sericytochromatia bacterium]